MNGNNVVLEQRVNQLERQVAQMQKILITLCPSYGKVNTMVDDILKEAAARKERRRQNG